VRDGDSDHVELLVSAAFLGSFEAGFARLPIGLEQASTDAHALLALDTLHATLVALAPYRDWDAEVLDRARDEVLAEGLVFRWAGPTKTSRDRKHVAAPVYDLHDDGFGRVHLEVIDRSTGELVARSESVPDLGTLAGFRRSAATLRWESTRRVTLRPSTDYLQATDWLVLDLDASAQHGAAPRFPALQDVDRPRPEVRVTVEVPDDQKQEHQIIGGGGGPANDLPDAYRDTLRTLLDAVRTEGLEWWSGSAERILQVGYDIGGDWPRVRLRRTTNKISARIQRPLWTLTPELAAAAARADVEELLTALARKQGLPPYPHRLP